MKPPVPRNHYVLQDIKTKQTRSCSVAPQDPCKLCLDLDDITNMNEQLFNKIVDKVVNCIVDNAQNRWDNPESTANHPHFSKVMRKFKQEIQDDNNDTDAKAECNLIQLTTAYLCQQFGMDRTFLRHDGQSKKYRNASRRCNFSQFAKSDDGNQFDHQN